MGTIRWYRHCLLGCILAIVFGHVALFLIALDVLVIFLYPWAVEIRQLELFGFVVMFIFILIIITGYIYAWKKKVLEWQ